MTWNDFFETGSVATYVVFIAGIVAAIIGFFIRRFLTRKRPRIIRVTKENEALPVKIDPEVRGDVAITYKGSEIASLYITRFSAQNLSQDVISDIDIKIVFSGSKIIDVGMDDPMPKRNTIVSTFPDVEECRINISFLNQWKLYRDQMEFNIFTLEPIEIINISGGGRDWKVEWFDKPKLSNDFFDDMSSLSGMQLFNPISQISLIVRYLPRFIKMIRK